MASDTLDMCPEQKRLRCMRLGLLTLGERLLHVLERVEQRLTGT